jgi:hypothetical protein
LSGGACGEKDETTEEKRNSKREWGTHSGGV